MHTFCIDNHLNISKTTHGSLRGLLSVVEKVSVSINCLMNVICIDINIFKYWKNNVAKLAQAMGQCLSFVDSGYSHNSMHNNIFACAWYIYSYSFRTLKLNYSYTSSEKTIELQCRVLEISQPECGRHFEWKGCQASI